MSIVFQGFVVDVLPGNCQAFIRVLLSGFVILMVDLLLYHSFHFKACLISAFDDVPPRGRWWVRVSFLKGLEIRKDMVWIRLFTVYREGRVSVRPCPSWWYPLPDGIDSREVDGSASCPSVRTRLCSSSLLMGNTPCVSSR